MQNKLSGEKSLYLLQHADNPVAWQPYNEETLKLAKKENKPLMISIGYSSCHWCHVMAHETFEDQSAADVINKYFVPIKIDREEFPDIDKKYQFYLHATGKRGGWPLTVFTMPDGRPYFGGTYFPPEARHSLPAFRDIATQLGNLYINTPKEAEKYAINYEKFLVKFSAAENTQEDLEQLTIDSVLNIFKNMTDKEYGGIGKDAKFPNIPVLNALMDFYDDEEIAKFLQHTADKMCTTGLYDHINGGFYRYAVDRQWHVPHFEKMLYDNAQNASFLLDLYEKSDNLLYLHIAEKTIDFILSEFNTEYGLISSMDADSYAENGVKKEGFYYTVSEDHLEPVLEEINLIEGVINLKKTDYESYMKLEPHFLKLKESNERAKPAKDSKIILSQNMLFCSALLKMFEMSGKEFYMEQARALMGKMQHIHMDGNLLFRLNYDGEVHENVVLEDYAYTIQTYLDFFEVTNEKSFLSIASLLTDTAMKIFYADGVFYLDTHKNVIDTFDDSTPNPTCQMIKIIENYGDYMNIAVDKAMLDFAADRLVKYSGGHPTLFSALKGYMS